VNETTQPMRPQTEEAALRARNLRTVGALAAVFVLPLLLSFWMYYGGGWRPAGQSNHGALITPAVPLERLTLQNALGDGSVALPLETWTLVYIGGGACDAACRNALHVIRQTRLALNQEMTRVERVWLVTGECCDRTYVDLEQPGLRVLDAAAPGASTLLAQFPSSEREHAIYIVDPLGNLMMRHDAREDPKGLLADLKKLLKLSHIG
jgi:hypothetical protein